MDDTTLVLALAAAVNRTVESFKLLVLSRFTLSDSARKGVLIIASALVGIVVMLFWPGASDQLLRGTVFAQYGVASQVLFGVALGFGSEFLFWLLKLAALLGNAPKTPPQETTPQG